jgi:hypothetical protein
MLAAAVAAVGLSVAASAITVTQAGLLGSYTGPIIIKYSNWDEGTLYDVSSVPANTIVSTSGLTKTLSPTVPTHLTSNVGPAGDSWGILRVSGIYTGDGNNNPLWTYSNSSPFEITGIFWGETDTNLQVSGGTEYIYGGGMNFAFFANATGSLSAAAPNNAAVDSATAGQLIWSASSVPGVSGSVPGAGFYTGFTPTTTAPLVNVNGAAWADFGSVVIGGIAHTGSLNGMFGSDAPSHDLSVQFTGLPATGSWLTDSQDPALAVSVPTPAAMSGAVLLVGIGAVNLYRRRRANQL